VLLVINGAPGVGKSALAERYARDHALALVLDIDELRRHLGQWETDDASKAVARDLALALVTDHLARGYDVVVPQFLGRREFAEALRRAAAEAAVPFVEVVLIDDEDALIARFNARRAELRSAGTQHPEAELGDDEVAPTIRAANADLRHAAAVYGLPLVPAGSDIEATYATLLACIE
jgi:predicted kinase